MFSAFPYRLIQIINTEINIDPFNIKWRIILIEWPEDIYLTAFLSDCNFTFRSGFLQNSGQLFLGFGITVNFHVGTSNMGI